MTATESSLIGLHKQSCARERSIYVCGELLIQGKSVIRHTHLVAEKVNEAGHRVRQIELCALRCENVIERERARGLEISERRGE